MIEGDTWFNFWFPYAYMYVHTHEHIHHTLEFPYISWSSLYHWALFLHCIHPTPYVWQLLRVPRTEQWRRQKSWLPGSLRQRRSMLDARDRVEKMNWREWNQPYSSQPPVAHSTARSQKILGRKRVCWGGQRGCVQWCAKRSARQGGVGVWCRKREEEGDSCLSRGY